MAVPPAPIAGPDCVRRADVNALAGGDAHQSKAERHDRKRNCHGRRSGF